MTRSIFIVFLCLSLLTCQKEELVYDTLPDENYSFPLLLRLDEKDCFMEFTMGILKYSINEDALQDYQPFVEFQEGSEVIFADRLLINNTRNNLGELSLNHPYELSIKSRGQIKHFQLVFTSIPTIQVVTLDAIQNEPKTLSRITLNYPESEKGSVVNWAGIEHRGASSLKYDKKSLGIGIMSERNTETHTSQSYFDLKYNHKWILNAMFTDASRLRNKVSFELWESLNGGFEHVGLQSRFVELFVNHESLGLYAFAENYTESFLALGETSVLYKGIDNSLVSKFSEIPIQKPQSAMWIEWEQKYPDPNYEIKWEDFESLTKLIVEADDETFKTQIADLLNLENVIDHLLFVNLIGGSDNVGKNWHFLKRNSSSLFEILQWDLDATWGRNASAMAVASDKIITNNLFQRLEETDPENYKQRLKERWNYLRETSFSQANLQHLLSRNFEQLKSFEIIELENELWESKVDLVTEQDYIFKWLDQRLAFLDEHFGN